jgi:hypothetical protein
MNALSKLSRSERITGVAGILLFIGIITFPWYHVGFAGLSIGSASIPGVSFDYTALQATAGFAGVLALIVLIALLAELVISRFTTVARPELPVAWAVAELYSAVAVLTLLVVKFLFHIGNFGWGFYADMVLAIALVYGAAGLRRGDYSREADAVPAAQTR